MPFPNIHLLLKVLATLPVSTASPERVFSKLERKLTAICSTMSEERLEALVLLQAHRDRVVAMSVEDIIDKFAGSGSRRLQFILACRCKPQVTQQCMTTDKSHIETIILCNSSALFCNLYYMYIVHETFICEL